MWHLECTVNNCFNCVVSSAFKWWTRSFLGALDASLQTTLIEETKGLLVLLTSKTSNFLVPLFRGRALNPPPWKLFLKINTAVHNVQCPLLSQIASIQLFWVFQFCLRSSWKYSVDMDARPPHISFLLLGHVFLLLQLASPAQIGFTHTQYSLVISSSFCFLPSSCTLYNGMNLLQFKPHNYLRLLNIQQDPWGNAASIARAIELLSSGQVVTNHGDGEDGDGEDGHHHHHWSVWAIWALNSRYQQWLIQKT